MEYSFQQPSHKDYGKEYFEYGIGSGYKNYAWNPSLIAPRLKAILNELHIRPSSTILDFGCAKGFYVRWLRHNGHNAIGLDISSYALSMAPADVRDYLFLRHQKDIDLYSDNYFDLTIVKDVLEHIPESSLKDTIEQLIRISKKLLVIVPICTEQGNYINIRDEIDASHVIRYTKTKWLNVLGRGRGLKCLVSESLCGIIKGANAVGTLCVIINTMQ